MSRPLLHALLLISTAWATPLLAAPTQPAAVLPDPLQQGFQNPPASARPRVWWHWMNGNVTKEGVRLDLEWMKRVGIGGVQNFDAALATPQVVPQRLAYMTPAWKDAFSYAVTTAHDLGLEFGVSAAPGWSESGGPWVPAQDGMKKLAWSVTRISDAGGPIVLAQPPSTTGPFQSIPGVDRLMASDRPSTTPPTLYRDVRVLAFRQAPSPPPRPKTVTSGLGAIDPARLSDGDLVTPLQIAAPGVATAWVLFDYGHPQSLRAASISFPAESAPLSALGVKVEASDDAVTFRPLAQDAGAAFAHTTLSFAPVTARYFRISLIRHPIARDDLLQGAAPGFTLEGMGFLAPPKPTAITQAVLSDAPIVNRFEAKAGYVTAVDYLPLATPAQVGGGVDPAGVIDLTDRMTPDGRLNWRAPPGEWVVMRLGWTLTGTQNYPATAEATGLEVDKLDPAAVHRYAEGYLSRIGAAAGPGGLGAGGIAALVNDSIESGPQNWTDDMIGEFTRRRGYDPTPWLPALTGQVIGDPAKSDIFLSDYRRTLGEMLAEAHYRGLAQAAHAHGMVHYSEADENGRAIFGDDMAMRRYADVPMGAMWSYRLQQTPAPVYLADIRGAASVAHIYGQPLVGAESMTSALAPWSYAPAELKRIIDQEFATGVNRPVIHTSVHQPTDAAPGLSLSIFGQFFNRHESWAEQARPWVDYLSRNAYLLQQGRFVADIAYFYGEDAPLTAIFQHRPVADAPAGHGYDFVNADTLLHALTVEHGVLVAPSGAQYRLLQLAGGDARMTLPTLRRIRDLVKAGVVVAGPRPLPSPSLADPAGEFEAIVAALWNGPEGRGHVFEDASQALSAIGLPRDVDADGVAFVHRHLADGDLYFLSNPGPARRVEVSLRQSGLRPQLWHAETGAREAVSWRAQDGRTVIPLEMAADDAVFVVLREPTDLTGETVATPVRQTLASLDEGWTLSFQPGRGAPAVALPAKAGSLADQADPDVKYFSGTASYQRPLTTPADWTAKGHKVWLDLGQVGDIAEILVNGQSISTLWHAPYAADISRQLHPGQNRLEVRVTNLWTNRLIGDVQPGATKIATVHIPTFKPDAPLRPSGLIGPVRLIGETQPAGVAR